MSGSTCCLAAMNGRHLVTLNIGNNRILVINKIGKVRQLTVDHTCLESSEL